MNQRPPLASSHFRIRPARPVDYSAIVEVWRLCALSISLTGRERESAFVDQLRHFPDSFLVATVDERVVGVVFGTHDSRKGWISRLGVHPEYQRKGLATALILECERAIRAHGIEVVAALVETWNTASAAVFAKAGFSDEYKVMYFRKSSETD